MNEIPLEQQVALLMQGTEYGDDSLKHAMQTELKERLVEAGRTGRPLRVYCGFDPRTSDLHLGHTIPMRKLRQFQELGHEVIFVIGRFTSLVGDPSDKDKVRAQITPEEAKRNAETYAEQAFRILDRERTRIEYNDTWLSELTFRDLIGLASNFTVQQFLTRDNFRKRWDEGDPIYLHETFYAIMQGYDAYSLKADVQVGGRDQLFNIITAARKLMEVLGEPPNIGIIMGILPGTDGVIRMSKSLGNHIPLNSTPEDMYGKVMSLPDSAMGQYARLVTRWSPAQIEEDERELAAGALHPRDLKMRLAREIVAIYHGEGAAAQAEEAFRTVFQEQGQPEEMPEFRLAPDQTAVDVLLATGLARSKTEARRLIAQRGVHLGDDSLDDPGRVLEIVDSAVLRVGKRRFVRLLPPE
jgi:tyrosyl-tRNA synthetase